MKKYLLWICTAATLLAVGASCSDDPDVDSVGRVGIQQTGLTADGLGENLTFDVTSNAYWRIEFTDPETGDAVRWVTATTTSGMGNAQVTLKVSRNRSLNSRSTYVNVITESENATAFVLLTQGAGTQGGGGGYSFPIYETFQFDWSAPEEQANSFVAGAECYFDGGMVLRRTGTPANLEFNTKVHTSPSTNWYFQRGVLIDSWATGDAFELEIPVKEELYGDLRYSFGSRRDGTQNSGSAWTFEWSSDREHWTKFDGTSSGGASDAAWKTIDFTIPEAKKIAAGGKLWIHHLCTDGSKASTSSTKTTVAYQTAFCVTRAKAEATTVKAMDNETVVFSTGFDDLIDAKAAYIDIPLGFMNSWNGGAYSLPKEQSGVVAFKECYIRPGFLQAGRGDEAFPTSRYTQGSYTIQLASRFETMRIAKCNLKLTFRASAMVNAYGDATDPGIVVVADEASGAKVVNGTLSGVANNEFKEFTVDITDATPTTEITITSAAMKSTSDDVRFFLDDISLVVNGDPERPSETDPVKASISDLRAKSVGTITDNLYVQGRVTALDNVPEGCFAVQDADAGLFVKAAHSTLAVGDQVEVVVKNATLAKTADGVLMLTPSAADQVSKTTAESEIPAYKSITVAELTAGTYEAMLVSLPESQVVKADLAKTLGAGATLETEDGATYIIKAYTASTLASTTVPQKRGAVKGISGKAFLLPASAADLAAMTGTRFGEEVYAITPICGMLKMISTNGTALNAICNATYDATTQTVTYTDNGCTITKLGNVGVEGSGLTWKATPYDGRFTTSGWGGDNWEQNALVFKIKATSILKGNLRFGFGLFAASTTPVPHNYKIDWSTDNATWHSDMDVRVGPYTEAGNNTFSIPIAANSGGYKMALFNIPESSAVASGQYLYIRIRQADNTECHQSGKEIATSGLLQFEHAFYLATHEKRAYHTTSLPSGANVVLSEGFDDAFYGHDFFIPTWQMSASSNGPRKYTAPDGWSVDEAGSVYELPGYIRLASSGTTTGSITTPTLTALGDTPTDITVSFKVAIHLGGSASYLPDQTTMAVSTEGAGTAAEPVHSLSSLPAECKPANAEEVKAMEDAYYKWYPVTVKVSGATKQTRITISATGRHYIDDLVITKD